MKYLLYYIDGFIKKFPLKKATITIGRTNENNLVIKDDLVSRKHVQINIKKDFIVIKDMDSTNGTYVDSGRVKEAVIKIGESFVLGGKEFYLKKGTLDEFKPSKDLISIFNKISNDNEERYKYIETRYIKDIYNETLKHIIKTGLNKNDFNSFISDLSAYLSNLPEFGSLFIVSKKNGEFNILLSIKNLSGIMKIFKNILHSNKYLFKEKVTFESIPKTKGHFCSFPFKISNNDASIVYISDKNRQKEDQKIEKFLLSLSKEIELLSQLFADSKGEEMDSDWDPDVHEEIIVGNEDMKKLIKQTKKIARSDIFILIQGESGTGKELFAKLIHKSSKRSKKELVGINCAAIPESLLESELFGHERGAFTGAYAQKKGKLEIASDGTLLFDEIGDMPLNLQSKLLRSLQESEFYRLGGSTPIKVDLRIISITNQNLKQLIEEKRFREDLYFRLVHHTITLPPLRERKEDISVLINFFTNKYCQQSKKTINGYSIKTFETLINYDWPGNVRQLENEINRIVNLTDDGETINYDILSSEIKLNKKVAVQETQFPSMTSPSSEKDVIVKLLEKNKWNKSKTARELNMTYQGLHKKMKRLGIKKDG